MHLLFGMSTDSGGGGTAKKLHKDMDPLALCCPADEHLVTNCCIHLIQVQLSNAVKFAFGKGALDKENAMQLLHSVCCLQELIELDSWRNQRRIFVGILQDTQRCTPLSFEIQCGRS